ncbi:MAG TPA: hypothetical protein VH022_13370 [Candidatus Acidoferrum sp.]|jgi:hypothetical protein|nr:hypothetical protein [Candidatus Acidoferrum sp.]
MNSKVVYAVLLALTLLIVLPVFGTVNATSSHHFRAQPTLVADGSPGPPPVPHPNVVPQEPELVADGSPGPPPVPHPDAEPLLVAAGSPGPPPVPNPYAEPLQVAAGSPGPPPVPNPWLQPELELVAA